ncbi:MAG: tRNA (adenosine(37)-N6)-threonylcarbamoyltransferase complex transferase subunit TsaD [Patescibacteria group bacterium]|nr:tRNA (adenosine(37)-N6)-threonylcarbamoyltransferase complex transferase subunit TsaD [Patescibacteria group bacterium]
MKILAFETSCDETGIALVEGKKSGDAFEFKVLRQALLSQAALHAPYGGVYPDLAKREHQKNLPALYKEFADDEYDAVAVTVGPGLEPALWQGIEFAERVARDKHVPLLPINHMEAHLLSSLAKPTTEHSYILENVGMSVLALLISGGHTEFVLMQEWLQYKVIGKTLDDAVGEAFDKVARMLDLPYPGGPEISKHATAAREKKLVSDIKLPRPMLHTGTCDVSFSGLKTAALYSLRDKKLSADEKAAFAAEFEEAVGDIFVQKTRQALNDTGAKTFVIGGGVAANRYLRERLEQLVLDEFPDCDFRLPHLAITGDNAVMIAQCALTRALSGKKEDGAETLRAVGNLSITKN